MFEQGKVRRGKFINVFYLKSSEAKVLFAVSKKVKLKPERNRIKRRLREIYRLHQDEFSAKQYYFGFVARRSALKAPFTELTDDFFAIMSEIGSE